MSDHESMESAHPPVTAKTFVWVWIFLVALTGVEVYLGYIELEPRLMLSLLLGLSIIKAGLIMSWFMHLKYEKRSLTLWLIPATVFCIGMMMAYFFWDSLRLEHLRPH
ncbi:MAG TPA: cytochrome C oxidase subunit IV family protein [Candidatus Acidoferrales bacterium]|jgi:caa(3)-type oxidase subunit IV|nr:cytochrome C oxidase subunit IV family protein [Candidatus Acidoferrales bacterium]